MEKKKDLTQNTTAGDPMAPIAIVGMASIMPDAENLEHYWDNILNEVNCIREVPASRWSVEDYFDPDPSSPDKSYSKYGGFIPDIDFDPIEFGLPPNLLEVTDVSQLLSLVVVRDALTDAGYMNADESLLDRTGVILGMVGMSSNIIQPLINRLQYPVWEKVLKSSGIKGDDIQKIIEKMKLAYISWNENAFPGAIGNVIAGRIANRFNLGGTNCVTDAACASSLAAVKMAISELIEGHTDMMITGGVDTDNSILTYMCFSKTPAFSKGDILRAFDGQSDGMLAGEGIGMMILKRLEDAEADHDRIYAVIKGIGSSSDGRSGSIYAPSSAGQAKALRRAYEHAHIPLNSVGLIEAHGTGTNAGDLAEFDGLREVFTNQGTTDQSIALGSVKSQIGHTKATAGAAALIKTSLALYHKVLPATMNVNEPNPAFNIKNSPFYINNETRPWFKKNGIPFRCAGVSAFGFGGTNFHVVLEEYTKSEVQKRIQTTPYTVLLSAQNNELLTKACQQTLDKLENSVDNIYLNQLAQQSENKSIRGENARIGFITDTKQDACKKLQTCIKLIKKNDQKKSWSHPLGIYYRSSGIDPIGKTVALFPGQGAQYVNMGKELVINFPEIMQTFEKANEIISSNGRKPLTDDMYPIPVFSDKERKDQKRTITKTENAQPAIGALSMGMYKLLGSVGFKADYFAGHSFGELTALYASGVFDEDAFIRLAKARGEAMALPTSSDQDTGTMIAVKGNIELILDILEKISDVIIANFNSPSQVVLAGSTQGIETLKPELEKNGLTVFPLQVSAAFHTSFVKHAQAPFKHAIEKETFQAPAGRVYSNSTALPYKKDPNKISQMLTKHILNPVLFKEEIENIYADGGSIFIEIGPKNILTNLVKDILKGKPHETIALNANIKGNSDLQFRQAVLQMRILGFKLGSTDTHKVFQTETKPAPSKVSIQLNGGLYTSEKTKIKFEDALHEEPFINSGVLTKQASRTAEPERKVISDQSSNSTFANSVSSNDSESPSHSNQTSKGYIDGIQDLVNRFQEHQSSFLQVHQQFLENDNISKDILKEIAQSEISIISGIKSGLQKDADQILSVLEKRAEFVNTQHSGTAAAHLEYIKSQTEFSQQYSALINGLTNFSHTDIPQIALDENDRDFSQEEEIKESQPVELHSTTTGKNSSLQANNTASPLIEIDQLKQSFLKVVSDKTGYPVEMLELGMDMEADLGIDSIKRVEILGAIQELYPMLPAIPAEDLVVLRTLEQIIGAFNFTSSSEKQNKISESVSENTNEKVPAAIDDKEIQSAFLVVVSEKTGYPVEMLELGMDMEADLGIDSIKRVEILGAIQEKYPQLPSITAEDLVVLRTLEQIIKAFNTTPAIDLHNAEEKIVAKVTPIPHEFESVPVNNINDADIQSAFLEIVSEKTGYPTDMLDLGMDLEADLGIDSIKRVEILGAMQEKFPQLPAIGAEDLANLRTLEQIITKFNKQDSKSEVIDHTSQDISDTDSTPLNPSSISRFPVEAIQIAQPDYLNFNLPKEDLVLITDDGTDRSLFLARSFSDLGQKVGMVHIGKDDRSESDRSDKELLHFYFKDLNEKKIKANMEEIIHNYKKIAAFIHMHPYFKEDHQDILHISERQAAVLKTVFLMARHLKKPLTAASADTRSAFLTITRVDGQFGLNGNVSHNPIPGGFPGLVKTLRMEWNSVFCRALDIHPDINAETVIQIINNELHDPNLVLAEVGYTKKGRYTLSLGKNEILELA